MKTVAESLLDQPSTIINLHFQNRVYHFNKTVTSLRQSSRIFSALEFGMATIHLAINGKTYSVDADPQISLLTALREYLDLTGSKYGCGEGQCGACTVLINGKAQRSCITRVGSVSGKQITTIEGLAKGDRLHPVQQAFLDEGAMQCAYCTSGMIMSAVALLQKNAEPSEKDIIDFMDGNICRCGTYSRIVRAIQTAVKAQAPAVAKGASR
jgi:aerobic-type carbon monoxide dehydrogenase small subunit (CoxS/CutS family)